MDNKDISRLFLTGCVPPYSRAALSTLPLPLHPYAQCSGTAKPGFQSLTEKKQPDNKNLTQSF